jgi:hypothetical protein
VSEDGRRRLGRSPSPQPRARHARRAVTPSRHGASVGQGTDTGPLPLADHPVESDEGDRLGFGVYADSLANLIDDPDTQTPITLGISGPWGAGKTSVGKLVAERLRAWPRQRGEPPHIVCWFDAWLHDDAPHLGAALAAEVARTANRHRRLVDRLLHPLPTAMLTPGERQRRVVIVGLLGLLLGVGSLLLGDDLEGTLVPDAVTGEEGLALPWLSAGAVAVLWSLMRVWTRVFGTAKNVAAFVDDPRSEAARGTVRQVRDQLHTLIRQATRDERRLVVFVDDLERCAPDRALEVCEVANQLLATPGAVGVLVADLDLVGAAARERHATIRPMSDLGSQYLHKIVQVEFDLPIAGREALARMLRAPAEDGVATPTSARQDPSPASSGVGAEPSSGGVLPRRAGAGTGAAIGAPSPGALRRTGRLGAYASLGVAAVLAGSSAAGADTADVTWVVSIVGLVALGSTTTWLTGSVAELVSRRRRRATTRQVDDGIVARAELSPDRLKREVVAEADHATPQLVSQRVTRLHTAQMLTRAVGDSLLLAYLPRSPRAAKRAWCHLHLEIAVALGRGLLVSSDPSSELVLRQLEKWVTLRQRWPAIALAVRDEPSLLSRLETSVTVEELGARLEEHGLDVVAGEQLLALLNEEPPLGGDVERFVSGPGGAAPPAVASVP